MSSGNEIWAARPQHDHRTITDAGACPECRQWNIDFAKEGCHGFVLAQYHLHDREPGARICSCCGEPISYDPERPDALALIRQWSPDRDDAVSTAWATGCNLGEGLAILGPLPPETIETPGLPLFQLIAGDEAVAGLQMVSAAARQRR